jgi:predicted DNA-binding protein (MmcQ/YjbR family)
MCQQKERMMAYMLETYGSEPERLWAKYPDDIVFRHPASWKWYAIIMGIAWDKLGIPKDTAVDVLDVKCSPLMIGSLLDEEGFFPAYHMNKNNWITIVLNDSVPDEKIYSLLELSYHSVSPKRKNPSRKPRKNAGVNRDV